MKSRQLIYHSYFFMIFTQMAKTDAYIDEVIKRFAEALEIKNREAYSSDEWVL